MNKLEEIRALCEKTIAEGDATLAKRFKDSTIPEDEQGFHWIGVCDSGEPNSYGNFDDCFEDGMDAGNYEGSYMIALKIMKILESIDG